MLDKQARMRNAHVVTTLHKIWGARVRELRHERGLTIAQLAYHAETNPGNISRIERGLEKPSDAVRLRIAAALGVDPNEIWSYPAEVAS